MGVVGVVIELIYDEITKPKQFEIRTDVRTALKDTC